MKLVRDEATVDDVLQRVVVEAHVARDRPEIQGGDPEASVRARSFALTRNLAPVHLRHRGRRARRALEVDVDGLARLGAGASVDELRVGVERGHRGHHASARLLGASAIPLTVLTLDLRRTGLPLNLAELMDALPMGRAR